MGMKYLWDTNTAIYYMQQQFSPSAEKFMDETLEISLPAISVVTEIELLCWNTTSIKDLQVIHNFLNDALIIELEKEIKFKTAEIRKAHKTKLPDAIIAATAIVYNLILISRNTADFKNIDGLTIIDPHNL